MATLSIASLRGLHRLLLLVALLVAPGPAPALPADPGVVHAAFTLNIARFISWPPSAFASADSPLIIGTLGEGPVHEALDHAAALDSIHGRPVRIVHVRSEDELATCHLVFFPDDLDRQHAILARVKELPVLTIGESPGFLALGGHVRFSTRAGRVSLHISADNLRASGLDARAQLLRLAETDTP